MLVIINHHHKEAHTHGAHEHGHANDHMNQTSFEDLVKRFESPERDAYQQPEKVLEYIGDVAGQKNIRHWSWNGLFLF